VVSDGTYLYVRQWGGASPNAWVKVASGLKDTSVSAGSFIATVGAALPVSMSGFYLDGYLYNGVTDAASSTVLSGVWKDASAESTSSKKLSLSRPLLSRWYGQDNTTTGSNDLLVASDGKDIYSAAMSTGNNKGIDGWKVRVFSSRGQFSRDITVPGPSYYTDGFIVDGKSAFFIEWTATNSARVTRASLSDGHITGRWTIEQASTRAINGSFDPSNNCIWIGQLDGGSNVMRFSATILCLSTPRSHPGRIRRATSSRSRRSTPPGRPRPRRAPPSPRSCPTRRTPAWRTRGTRLSTSAARSTTS
jgi:hypothetical protein